MEIECQSTRRKENGQWATRDGGCDGRAGGKISVGKERTLGPPRSTFLSVDLDPHRTPACWHSPLIIASMSNPTALRTVRSICASCRSLRPNTLPSLVRPFSQSRPTLANDIDAQAGARGELDNIFKQIIPTQKRPGFEYQALAQGDWEADTLHHLHIYAHKHNTHITLTSPDRNPLVSVSCGNIGFKKAGRGTYDAAYQLTAFVMNRIRDKGWLPRLQAGGVELVYRGFGAGREAATKAILGTEGKDIRPLIKKLSDGTRLKFGGVRSKKPRRLG